MMRALLALLLLATPAAARSPWEAPPDAPALVLRNATADTVRELYVAPEGARRAGPDRLGQAVLPPGASFRIPLAKDDASCRQGLRAVFEDGGEDRLVLDLCAAGEAVLDDSRTRRLEVVNDTDFDLLRLHLSVPGATGPDRLGRSVVRAHERLRVALRGVDGCAFTARAVFLEAREEARQEVDLCASPRVAFGDPSLPLREVTLRNAGPRVVRALFLDGDGRDRLGAQVLRVGQDWVLRTRTAACHAALRAVRDDGTEERLDLDLCAPGAGPVALGG